MGWNFGSKLIGDDWSIYIDERSHEPTKQEYMEGKHVCGLARFSLKPACTLGPFLSRAASTAGGWVLNEHT